MATHVLVLTTNECPGKRVHRVLGAVFGISVQSRSSVGNFLGMFGAAGGGSQHGYEKVLADARRESVENMCREAARLGANAVLAMRYDSGEFGTGNNLTMIQVVAYGTAVVLASD